MVQPFKAPAKHRLDYANTVWSPLFYKTDFAVIESVQRRTTKLIIAYYRSKNIPYEEKHCPALHTGVTRVIFKVQFYTKCAVLQSFVHYKRKSVQF